MNARPVSVLTSVSVWALWGLLAAIPQSALGIGATPAVRGHAALDVTIGNAVRETRCLNNGVGGFTNCATFNDFDTSTGIALGDMNGDGKLDAVMVNYNEPAVRCLNDGFGNLGSCVSFNVAAYSFGVALGDVNGDGSLDVIIANTQSQPEFRCLNDGSGGFTNCASFNTTDASFGIALGDVDGNGALDAIIANSGESERVCLNDGSGNFGSCSDFNTINDDSRAVALADIDGDGALDVVVANTTSQAERLCLNDGSGGFTACSSFNATDSSFGIALGDVNNDGRPDALIANSGQEERRCLNDGAGGFASCVSFSGTDSSEGIALGDLNADGHLDVVTANNLQQERRCLNDGAGGFTDCTTFNATDISRSIALGKLDNDGLTDVTPSFAGGVTTSNFSLTLASMATGIQPLGLDALYSFDTQYCNSSGNTLSNLRTRTVRLSQGNALHFNNLASNQYLTAPEWREGGIGAELVIPLGTGQYSDGQLAPTECATINYPFHLFSLNRYRYAVRLYGVVAAPPPVDDPAPPGLMAARTITASDTAAIELDLGPLAEAATATPPMALPGGTAPTPYAPALSFPAGVSNLPSRR